MASSFPHNAVYTQSSHVIGCSTATLIYMTALSILRCVNFPCVLFTKCLTICVYVCTWICVLKCEHLALFSQAIHMQVTNDD